LFLPVEDTAEKFDVLDGQSQDLVLAELLLRRVSGNQLAKFSERTAHVLLAPAFTTVAECLARENDEGASVGDVVTGRASGAACAVDTSGQSARFHRMQTLAEVLNARRTDARTRLRLVVFVAAQRRRFRLERHFF